MSTVRTRRDRSVRVARVSVRPIARRIESRCSTPVVHCCTPRSTHEGVRAHARPFGLACACVCESLRAGAPAWMRVRTQGVLPESACVRVTLCIFWGRMAHHNGAHNTARELSANWLHRRGTRRVLTPVFCHAVHRCACVSAGTPTPAPTLTPARSPTLAPTTVAPAVAPSGMSSPLSTLGYP